MNYTVGQRRGLGVQFAEPLYVIDLQPETNSLVVGTADELGASVLIAGRFNWVSGVIPSAPFAAQVKIRYKATPAPAWIEPLDGCIRVTFDAPLRDITAGQGAVVYDNDVCLGGGVIERVEQLLARPADVKTS